MTRIEEYDGIELNDSATAPNSEGEIRLNGNTVEIYSNNEVRNVSAIDRGARRKQRAQDLIEAPNASLQTVNLPAGEGTKIAHRVKPGEILTVYRWGCFKVDTGFAPTGLRMQLVDESGNVVVSERTTDSRSTNGVASYDNSGASSVELVSIRTKNTSSNTYNDVATVISYSSS